MKKTLFFVSALALLTACNSGYQQDGPDAANAGKREASSPADLNATNADSAAGAKTAAIAHQEEVDTAMTHMGTSPTGQPAGGAGAKLVAAADCASCHRENEKLLGPAYIAVAEKYPETPANITMLSQHIIKGGAGHWGDIAMTPHPNLSESDAKQMVTYILSLK